MFFLSVLVILFPLIALSSNKAYCDEWEWVGVDGATCGNGSDTGFGIYRSDDPDNSNKLAIIFLGGGACWNYRTCNILKTALNINKKYDEDVFRLELEKYLVDGTFNFPNLNGAADGYNIAYIPYCTGDLHSGNRYDFNTKKYHVGFTNYGLYLKKIKEAFYGGVDEIVMVGISAGGLGAYWNYERTKVAFDNIPMTLINDSFPPMKYPRIQNLQKKWTDAWGSDETAPCAGCERGNDILLYLVSKYTEDNFAFISFMEDVIVRLYFGASYHWHLLMPKDEFKEALLEIGDELELYSNGSVYYINGGKHGALNETYNIYSNGVFLGDWIVDAVNGSSDWTNVIPRQVLTEYSRHPIK
jgi:hypothetical protein